MIRLAVWAWHMRAGLRWARRADRKARASRDAYRDNRLCAERARRHFARADDLYPPPPRGPPGDPIPADGESAAAHQDGPEIRDRPGRPTSPAA